MGQCGRGSGDVRGHWLSPPPSMPVSASGSLVSSLPSDAQKGGGGARGSPCARLGTAACDPSAPSDVVHVGGTALGVPPSVLQALPSFWSAFSTPSSGVSWPVSWGYPGLPSSGVGWYEQSHPFFCMASFPSTAAPPQAHQFGPAWSGYRVPFPGPTQPWFRPAFPRVTLLGCGCHQPLSGAKADRGFRLSERSDPPRAWRSQQTALFGADFGVTLPDGDGHISYSRVRCRPCSHVIV